MPPLRILQHPDPKLRMLSAPVADVDASMNTLIDDLFDTLYSTSGIGLSAPQTGHLWRVMVMDLSENRDAPECLINPEILDHSAPGLVEESCLSIPGVVGNVVRSTRIRVRALDRDGRTVERDLEGMYAVCVQHEIDHLDGKLFIDRLSFLRRLQLRIGTARQRRRAKVSA